MAATNIFYRLPSQRGTKIASIAGTQCTLDQFCQYIIDIEGLNRQDFIIASGTKVFRPNSCSLQTISLQNNFHVDILIPLLGGKGGFGSLLRAIGAQIEKTTNRDACRDLSGRRLRDIKREEELKKLFELKAKLEEERREKKLRKLEKLKRESEKSRESASIQELVSMFQDHEYNRRRMEIGEILDAAVEKGLINAKKRPAVSVDLIENNSKKAKIDRVTGSEDKTTNPTEENTPENLIASIDPNSKVDDTNSRGEISRQDCKRSGRNANSKYLWLGLDEELDVSSGDEQCIKSCAYDGEIRGNNKLVDISRQYRWRGLRRVRENDVLQMSWKEWTIPVRRIRQSPQNRSMASNTAPAKCKLPVARMCGFMTLWPPEFFEPTAVA